ncbi:hypothetical protein ACFOY8_13340 [Thalassospira xianhensis]|uniref:hypothetical protein n=1 Tax=Thalassospira xianhensis TaxID=478503 RepID=UPI000DED91DC|nr:hypothetical protein [Thalassospira xianhensis]
MIKSLAANLAISTSMILAATNAMASVGQDQRITIPDSESLSPELDDAVNAALGSARVSEAVSDAFLSLMQSYVGEDGQTLSEHYFPGVNLMKVAQAGVAADSTMNTDDGCYTNCYGNCYNNCHGACHGACHGSRGWR